MQWPIWVVLIAGSTGFALRLFALPTFTSRRVLGAISLNRQRSGLPVSLAFGHHCPGHSGELIG
jgi:hypothetical protein